MAGSGRTASRGRKELSVSKRLRGTKDRVVEQGAGDSERQTNETTGKKGVVYRRVHSRHCSKGEKRRKLQVTKGTNPQTQGRRMREKEPLEINLPSFRTTPQDNLKEKNRYEKKTCRSRGSLCNELVRVIRGGDQSVFQGHRSRGEGSRNTELPAREKPEG